MWLFTRSVWRAMSKPPTRARPDGRAEDAAQHADRGRLAGAVRSEEAEHGAGGDPQVDVVDGDEVAEDPRQALHLDRGRGHVAASVSRRAPCV